MAGAFFYDLWVTTCLIPDPCLTMNGVKLDNLVYQVFKPVHITYKALCNFNTKYFGSRENNLNVGLLVLYTSWGKLTLWANKGVGKHNLLTTN